MIPPRSAPDESERLRELRRYAVLDTPPDPVLDDLAAAAAAVMGAPMASIAFVARERQWIKARVGHTVVETSRADSLSGYVVEIGEDVVVCDAREDERFHDNPYVIGGPHIRFFAGVPLRSADGHVLGALSVLDTQPRTPTPHDIEQIRRLGRIAMAHLASQRRANASSHFEALFETSPVLPILCGRDGRPRELTYAWADLLGIELDVLYGLPILSLVHPGDAHLVEQIVTSLARGKGVRGVELRHRRSDGEDVWLSWYATWDPQEELVYAVAHNVTAYRASLAELERKETELRGKTEMLDAVRQTQAEFIHGESAEVVFPSLLDRLLALTGSRSGMVREVVIGPFGLPSLTAVALATRGDDGGRLAELATQAIDVRSPDPLVVTVVGDAGPAPVLMVPIAKASVPIAVVALAGRDGGYPPAMLAATEPLFAMVRSLVRARREALDRAASERALRESESRFRTLFDLAPIGIFETASDGTALFPNAEWQRISGFTREQVFSGGWARVVHPEDRLSVGTAWATTLAERQRFEMTLRFRRPSGEVRWVSARALPLPPSSDGEEMGIVGTVEDITERETAEATLREFAQRMRTIFDSAADAIVVLDERGAIEWANRAAGRLFGDAVDELTGRAMDELLVTTADGGGPVAEFRRGPRADTSDGGPKATVREAKARGRDGKLTDVELSLAEMRFGGHIHATLMMRDITARKEVERLKSEFVATVSHELRTPLTSIRGALGLLAAGAAGLMPPGCQDLVDVALKNSERLVRLVSDILDVEKMQAGKFSIDHAMVDLRRVVEATVAEQSGYASQFGVTTDVSLPEAPATVRGDAGRLAQVLSNLLSNAAKYSPPGGRVDVAVRMDAGMVRVSVRDRGPGVPDDFKGRIFERFAQADTSDARRRGGTGLGLNIARDIVALHGGLIGHEQPTDGPGAVFTVSLPYWQGGPAAASA
jgi:PAS domain S-box-containing protein